MRGSHTALLPATVATAPTARRPPPYPCPPRAVGLCGAVAVPADAQRKRSRVGVVAGGARVVERAQRQRNELREEEEVYHHAPTMHAYALWTDYVPVQG